MGFFSVPVQKKEAILILISYLLYPELPRTIITGYLQTQP